jgi:hypothetical protein
MRILVNPPNNFILEHNVYSPALLQAARTIPGITKLNANAVIGSADAIQAAVEYLVTERGLNRGAFEGCELLEVPKWGKK